MTVLLWLSAAFAGPDLGHFVGLWGLDPSKSDDPTEAFALATQVAPDVRATAAARYAPDGGVAAAEDEQEQSPKRALDDAYTLLGASGGLQVATVEEGVTVTWTGTAPVTVPLTRRYVKVKGGERPWRVRAWMDGDHLVVERRMRSTSVAETLLPPERADELVVVVWVEGSSLGHPVEFRRVYRALATDAAG